MKSHGNIVCFRNLKPKTDEAIALFSNREARETILMGPYEDYVAQFNAAALDLMKIAATPGAVDRLESEDDILAFVQAFRTLLRIRNVLATFAEFSPDDLMIEPQRFEDYKSKYLDIYDRTKADQERDAPASIIGEVDFELELIRRDEINVAYILALLGQISKAETEDDGLTPAGTDARVKSVLDMLSADPKLRSKRELIEEFVASFLPRGNGAEATRDAFISFWDRKRVERFEQICSEEKLDPERFGALIEAYQFSSKAPLRDDVAGALVTPPSILDRRKIADRILAQMIDFVETFDENVGDLEAA
jgi:type I restriction enzyme R subunit